jgi:hypothetical protein
MATYSVGDRVNCIGAAESTYFNFGLATILSLDYDGTVGSETATMTLDLPMSTDGEVIAYVEGEIDTLPVNQIIGIEFYHSAISFDAAPSFYLEGTSVGLVPGVSNSPDAESAAAYSADLEKRVMGAIQEVLRSPWPTANAMIKDSYGMYFDY